METPLLVAQKPELQGSSPSISHLNETPNNAVVLDISAEIEENVVIEDEEPYPEEWE